MTIVRWDELQLRFDLPDLDEAADDALERAISPEEARLISEAARRALEETLTPALSLEGRGKKLEWLADYLFLRDQNWPWRVACYIAWASSPRLSRWPKTLGELATSILGLRSPRVIYKWRMKYASIETVVSMMQARPLWEHRADVYKALVEMATDPNYKAHNDRKLFLEMIGDYVPRSMLGVGKAGKGGDLAEMSEEELKRWAGEMVSQVSISLGDANENVNGDASGDAKSCVFTEVSTEEEGEGAGDE